MNLSALKPIAAAAKENIIFIAQRVFAMIANNFECERARRVAQGCRPRGETG